MSSSKNKGKRPATDLQQNQQHHPLHFLKPIIRPQASNWPSQSVPTNSRAGPPYITLVVPDGRCISHRCFWKQQQNGSIALTHGWPEFYRMYQINLDSILLFKHKGNSEFQVRIFDFSGHENTYSPRPSKEPPYEAKGAYRRARCINNPSSHKTKEIAQTHKTKWPFFVMDLTDRVLHSHLLPNVPHLSHFTGQRHTLFLSHGHIEVEATYTRFSGRRDSCFGIIFGGWAEFASLCKFEPGGVGIFEVISTELVTILQVRWSNNAAGS
ncbi:B3 domain-containing protein REM5-like [Arachis hypogaea]|uniref:B3 domain-containing protein REM5-like n=1 Tax=Arachis hypogaea TaxID=3818 RepID=UPI000DECBF25|nr:B3 domain-containing protein REM5-like [Arachis hypogaea]